MHFSNTPAPRPSGLLRVASVNVNGIRAAYKKDMAGGCLCKVFFVEKSSVDKTKLILNY